MPDPVRRCKVFFKFVLRREGDLSFLSNRYGCGRKRQMYECECICQYDECVQSPELQCALGNHDITEFRKIHQRGRPTGNRCGLTFPILTWNRTEVTASANPAAQPATPLRRDA